MVAAGQVVPQIYERIYCSNIALHHGDSESNHHSLLKNSQWNQVPTTGKPNKTRKLVSIMIPIISSMQHLSNQDQIKDLKSH